MRSQLKTVDILVKELYFDGEKFQLYFRFTREQFAQVLYNHGIIAQRTPYKSHKAKHAWFVLVFDVIMQFILTVLAQKYVVNLIK